MNLHRSALALVVIGLWLCAVLNCAPPASTSCDTVDDCVDDQICDDGECTDPECRINSDCSSGKACRENRCVSGPSCKDECTLNQKRCSGAQIQTCQKLSSGCTAWGASENCPSMQECRNGSCVSACTSNCPSEGKRECLNSASYRICQKTSKGCLMWSSSRSCAAGQSCSGGSCATVKTQEGQPCKYDSDCVTGLICSGWPESVICTRNCSRSADCPSGRACYKREGGGQVCAAAKMPPIDAKCKVVAKNAVVDGADDSWAGWGEGAPDAFVRVEVPGKTTWESKYEDENWKPSWYEQTTESYTYSEILSMTVSLMDYDSATGNDVMGTWSGRWTMTSAKSQQFTLPGTKLTLYISVNCSF